MTPSHRSRPHFRWSSFLRRINVENKGLKLLSLLLAIFLFAVSRQPKSDIRLIDLPLQFSDTLPGVEISGVVDRQVSVQLRGPRDLIRSLTPNQISVIANVSNKEPGDRVVQLRPSDVQCPDGIEVRQLEPASIRLRLEPTMRKSVKIEPHFMGEVASGKEVYLTTVDPPTIEIEGPQSQIEKVNHILTESVNLYGRDSNFSTTVDLETPHTSVRFLRQGPFKLSVEIGEKRRTRRIINVPVQLLSQSAQNAGYRITPKTIEVELYGPESAIEHLAASDLRVELEVNSSTTDLQPVKPRVRLPAGADKNIRVKTIPLEVKVKRN
jgi:YbbR domain-containing protein